jgi:hypothetical protein
MRFASSFVLIGVALTARGQISQSKSGYQFNIKYVVGKVTNYSIGVSYKINGKTISESQKLKTTVLSIKKNGNAKLKVTDPAVKRGTVSVPESSQFVELDRFGRAIDFAQSNIFAGTFAWPDKPVKIGDKWSGDVNLTSGAGPVPVKSDFIFKGINGVGSAARAIILMNISMSGNFKLTGQGRLIVKVKDGQFDNALINLKMQLPNSSKPTALTVNITSK